MRDHAAVLEIAAQAKQAMDASFPAVVWLYDAFNQALPAPLTSLDGAATYVRPRWIPGDPATLSGGRTALSKEVGFFTIQILVPKRKGLAPPATAASLLRDALEGHDHAGYRLARASRFYPLSDDDSDRGFPLPQSHVSFVWEIKWSIYRRT